MKYLLTLLLACLVNGTAIGQGFNFINNGYDIDHFPSSIATGDMDGDSDLDLVVCGQNSITLFFNDGSGKFLETLVLASESSAQTVAIADLDDDGDLDLVSEHFVRRKVLTYLNNGDGSFQDFVATSVPSGSTTGLAIADFDGDKRLDVVTTSLGESFFEPGFVVVLTGNGDGTFDEEVDYAVGNVPFGVETSDVDSDGLTDLIVWNSEFDGALNLLGNTITILRNNGDGTFVDQTEFVTGGFASHVLVSGDLDGDGNVDLVTANSASENLSFILGNGDGTFQEPLLVDLVTGVPQEIVAADVDGDSDLDIVIACSDEDTLTFLVNQGDGGFAVDGSFVFGDIPVSVLAADFDGDGKDNLATGYSGSGQIVTIAIDCATFVLGDTNGDGDLDLTDIATFVDIITEGEFQPEADINMDGFVNLMDVQPFVDLLSGSAG